MDTYRDSKGVEKCKLTQLIPAPFRAHLIKKPNTQRWNKAVFADHHPLILDTESTKDRANSLTAVDHRWLR